MTLRCRLGRHAWRRSDDIRICSLCRKLQSRCVSRGQVYWISNLFPWMPDGVHRDRATGKLYQGPHTTGFEFRDDA